MFWLVWLDICFESDIRILKFTVFVKMEKNETCTEFPASAYGTRRETHRELLVVIVLCHNSCYIPCTITTITTVGCMYLFVYPSVSKSSRLTLK